ncbi:MAG: phosphate ABC transporter permease PstA [Bacteroidetes bacterium]|nr:phosphate ABC transporter permease PstA [Bacteroidota bacterium]
MANLANDTGELKRTILDGRGFSYWRRKTSNVFFSLLFSSSILIVLLPLLLIIGYLFYKGAASVNLDFFLHRPAPVGEHGGGMGNAIIGSLYVVGIASLIGIPVGLLGGMFVGEFPHSKFSTVVRFVADVLNGTPSIVMGVFAYTVVVLPMKSFSALAGGFALGVMMIPTILRTTDEILQTVPTSIREASLALGVPYWRTVLSVVLRSAKSGIITGILLAGARVLGETAPLLFTSFNNAFYSYSVTQPISTLPVQIFNYAISPYRDWHRQAWAGALVLVLAILVVNLAVRTFSRQKFEQTL